MKYESLNFVVIVIIVYIFLSFHIYKKPILFIKQMSIGFGDFFTRIRQGFSGADVGIESRGRGQGLQPPPTSACIPSHHYL